MGLYKLKAGRYARFEKGKRGLVRYKIGDLIELTDADAKRLSSLVEKVETPEPAPAIEPQKFMRAAVPVGTKSTTVFPPPVVSKREG